MNALVRQFFSLFCGRRRGGITFTGDYSSWAEALQDSSGYDSPQILEKTRAALLQVKNGEAVYERDSVLFDKVQHSFPLLAGLLRAALEDHGVLSVLDFGGALGSSYFQCRAFLEPVKKLEWLVVEQAAPVECGKQDFASSELNFYSSAQECLASHRPNVILLSAVLHYLASPYQVLADLSRLGVRYIIIDRTPFLASGRERLTVQHVPTSIYPASYPAWFFNERKLTDAVRSAGYHLIADFEGFDRLAPPDEKACCKGFIFKKEDQA